MSSPDISVSTSSLVKSPLKIPSRPLKMSALFSHSRGLSEIAEKMLLIPL